jgi:hypothetical protein
MPVHHRLRFLTFPMRTSRLCSLWPDMRSLRFRRVPFGRDGAFDPGGATASRIAMPHILPSTVPSVSASATFFLSWLNPPPHPITVYASHPPSPTTAQHSLPGSALPPYRGRSFTGRNASASPDAPEPEVRIHLPPAKSQERTLPYCERCCGTGPIRGSRWQGSDPISLATLDVLTKRRLSNHRGVEFGRRVQDRNGGLVVSALPFGGRRQRRQLRLAEGGRRR